MGCGACPGGTDVSRCGGEIGSVGGCGMWLSRVTMSRSILCGCGVGGYYEGRV